MVMNTFLELVGLMDITGTKGRVFFAFDRLFLLQLLKMDF